MENQSPGYMARNADVTSIKRINSNLCKIMERMRKRRDCPSWLIMALIAEIQRANCLIPPLEQLRDALKEEHQTDTA